jgi:hypothetical protein
VQVTIPYTRPDGSAYTVTAHWAGKQPGSMPTVTEQDGEP